MLSTLNTSLSGVVSICLSTIDCCQEDTIITRNVANALRPSALKNVSAMFGAFIGSYPTDKFGRKWMILIVQIIMIGAAILEQFATTWTQWLGARLLDVSEPL